VSVEVRLAFIVQRSDVTWRVLEGLGIARQGFVISLLFDESVAELGPSKTPSKKGRRIRALEELKCDTCHTTYFSSIRKAWLSASMALS
jgi:hypothetical protein